MKTKTIFLLLLLISFWELNLAQDRGLTLLLGPAVNIYYGNTDDEFSYSPERLSWQLNGQFGYISTRGGTNRGNMLGIFASAGNTKPEMMELMHLGGAEMQGELDVEKIFNPFFTLEGGMVVARFLRMSGGIGRQAYTFDSGERGILKFYCGTLGVAFDLGVVNWVIDANLITGEDLNQKIVRFSTGFLVKF